MKEKLTVVLGIIAILLSIQLLLTFSPFAITGYFSSVQGIKVGAILDLTGPVARNGIAMQQGIELAAEELNLQGNNYRIIFEDDALDTTKAVQAANKLLNIDKIDVGLITAVNEGKSVSRFFEEAKTPLIVLWDANKELERGNYTFGIGFSTETAGQKMAEFAYINLTVKKVGIIYHFDEWSVLIHKEFAKRFEELGGKVGKIEGTEIEEKDYRTVITKMKDVDGIYFPLVPPGNSLVTRQARELGFDRYLLTADGFIQDEIDAAREASNGVYFTNVYVPNNTKIQKLVEKYKEKYGKEPQLLVFNALGYDAMMAIHEAQKTGNIHSGLYQIRFDGATGIIDFDETGMSPRFERIFVVENSKEKLVE